jgi:catechol 2,3-dioxygenase-like lactoylglutathione lyase family enzyme
MKRMHVHVRVDDLAAATRFYADLFGQAPSVTKPDYAKWMLDDPRVNFAVSARGGEAGLDHLGIQVDEAAELDAVTARLERAGHATFDKGAATCCYAESDKAWTRDPAGLKWETFHTTGAATTYGAAAASRNGNAAKAVCCAPTAPAVEPAPARAACC